MEISDSELAVQRRIEKARYAREWRRLNKDHQRKYESQPHVKERKARQKRERRNDPVFKAKEYANNARHKKTEKGRATKRRLDAKYRAVPANKIKALVYAKQHNAKPGTKAYKAAHARKKRADPQVRVRENLRTRIGHGIRKVRSRKTASTMQLIGCSYVDLRAHIESIFTAGMSWDNYGIGGWEIDHITPCAAFDLTKEDEQMRCFHWSNLRPCWNWDNRSRQDLLPCGRRARELRTANNSFSNNVEGNSV